MAFDRGNSGSSYSYNKSSDDSWKSQGFVNLKHRGIRLGALGLQTADDAQADIFAMCEDNAVEGIEVLRKNFILTYQPKTFGKKVAPGQAETQGYIRFSLPTDGEPQQLGFIALKDDEGHANLRRAIEASFAGKTDEERAANQAAKLVEVLKELGMEYRNATKAAPKKFVLKR